MILDVGEYDRARPKADFGTGLVGITGDGQGTLRLPEVIGLRVDFPVAINGQFELVRQRVDDRHPDAV